ncbi:tRNA (adenine-N1)-methyltransferase [Methanobacterium ferruginis]|uniref:tRNA (adenine-N1)-methyltransferase n=1 Tax=Methanobacterium ferruginis TaxID=710191 RepID=UPI002573CD04|nr:tRNA (adenine-N1)-methyltransferase [Methanobacterium ferruginis]BDZ67268.1 SAM-dependent methyltransferase [Methanobacterium ferruginis]
MKILINERGKKFIAGTDDLHTDQGYIKKEEIENSHSGDVLKTHLGREFRVLEANVNDYVELMDRRCSIILPKDLGVMAAYTGLGCGQRVVEAGTGAGATTIFLGNLVGETGHVYSYELREDFAQVAGENIKGFGLENVTLKCQDVEEGISEEKLDLVFLDLPKPWEMVEHARAALKSGGFLVAYTPYVDQVKLFTRILKKRDFSDLKSLECLVREMEVKDKGVRPKTRMTGHTGYLTFGRKI